jgi:exonuclease VII large subunit
MAASTWERSATSSRCANAVWNNYGSAAEAALALQYCDNAATTHAMATLRQRCDNAAATLRQRCDNAATTLRQRCNNAATTLRQRCNNAATTMRQRCDNAATTLQQRCDNAATTLRQRCDNAARTAIRCINVGMRIQITVHRNNAHNFRAIDHNVMGREYAPRNKTALFVATKIHEHHYI